MRTWFVVAALCAVPSLAHAGATAVIPEPETLALVGIGAVALLVAKWRRRK